MASHEEGGSLLSPYLVLDLADEKGAGCGAILAELGATVLKVEPPGGDRARNIGPFYHDIPDPEKSLSWFVFNANKKGITLNIEAADGKEIFKKLVARADFVIESFPPGYMGNLGLSYADLEKLNHRIIVTSITPFGQTGPYSTYKASDLVAMAVGGAMYSYGDPDRPPVRMSVPQAFLYSSAYGAATTMIAHYYRQLTGEGQHVDVSVQESVVRMLGFELATWEGEKRVIPRAGPRRMWDAAFSRLIWPCKDGHVSYVIQVGKFGKKTLGLVEDMKRDGIGGALQGIDFSLDAAQVPEETLRNWEGSYLEYFSRHTRAELFGRAKELDLLMLPGNTEKEIFEDEHLRARGYWRGVEHPELNTSISYPGPPYKFSECDCGVSKRAPFIGEHNKEVYEGLLGLSPADLITLKETGII